MQIVLHRKRPGWFKVPFDVSQPLWGVPGSYFEDGLIIAHGSHLPLLDVGIATKHLPPTGGLSTEWAKRDASCEAQGFKLRTTQQQAIDFALPRRGILLCDEQRLGKTASAVMMDHEWRLRWTVAQQVFLGAWQRPQLPYGPLVIVAPLSTRAVWLSWIKRIYQNIEIGIIQGKTFDKTILQQPIVFGHYDIIHKWMSLFEIGTLILDEVQFLTNPDSRRTKAARLLAGRAKHVVACTGTPINKFPPDMYAVLDMVAPGAWGSYYEFAQRYGNPTPTAHGTRYEGISNETELRDRLSEVMIRRLWRDVHKDLPPITRSIVVADLTKVERNKLDILAGKIKAERSNVAANLASYRRTVSSIKLSTVLAEVEKVVERGEPVVVWTWHKDFAEKILKKLSDKGIVGCLINGDIAILEREKRMAEWRARSNAVLIATMAVAGAGIDLSHARIAVFAEIDYTPAILGQAEMRTFSPLRAMDVLFVVANHLVDQRIVRSLVGKLSASDPLGVAAAIDAIDALRDAVLGPDEEGDLDRLLEDLLASC